MDDRCEAWVASYDDPNSRIEVPGGGIAVSPQSDRIYQAGTSWSHLCQSVFANCGDIVTVAYDPDGQQVWEARYNGPANNHDQGNAVAVSPDGSRVYTAGVQDFDGNDGSTVVVAYDAATGNEVWTARYDDPPGGRWSATFWDIIVSPDSEEVYVAGRSEPDPSSKRVDLFTVAYDADSGARLWDARYDGPTTGSNDEAWDMGVSPDGSQVYVSGSSTKGIEPPGGWARDYATVAYRAAPADDPGDPEPGTQLWVSRYDAADRNEPWGGMAVSPDGSLVIVTGFSNPATNDKWATVAYHAASGAEAWLAWHGEESPGTSNVPQGLAFSPKGDRVFVVGSVGGNGDRGKRFGVAAYDTATGTALWNASYSQLTGTGSEAWAVAVSPDGETVYVSGNDGPREGDTTIVATVAYGASDGTLQWVARFDTPRSWCGEGYALWANQQLFASADGKRLYLSATSSGMTTPGVFSNSWRVLAYDVE